MPLYYREIGCGERVVVILHGLYGSSDNWMTIAKKLQQNFRVILPDQRNHGRSFHNNEHTYNAMASDLLELLHQLKINKINLAGHSMGGKCAMKFAINYPELVESLAVIDIAPKKYVFDNTSLNNHPYIIDTLISINISDLSERSEIDSVLEKQIPDKALRSFLMKNIRRNKDNEFYWQLNLKALKNNLDEISDGFSHIETDNITKMPPSLFIKGKNSDYITSDDIPVIKRFFPNSEIITIPNASHWLHAEKPDCLVEVLTGFFD